jgi:DNA processing protein
MIRDWVELNMTPGIGPRAAAKLLERFGSAEAVYSATRAELEQLRLAPDAVDTIIGRNLRFTAEAEIAAVRKLGGDILLLDDGVYPSSLREIYDPPIVLYVKGAWSECLDQPCIGVVGSRRASTYGQNAALMLARDLAQRGMTVVSGFARGIDAAAHRGALEGGGRTVAVLGTGIDEVYPRDHKQLAEEILARGGVLVSQFPLGTPPVSENFPYRNRIISGLSFGGGGRGSGREFGIFDNCAPGDGTEPRGVCRAGKHYFAKLVRHQLPDQRRRRQARATVAGHRSRAAAATRGETLAAAFHGSAR